MSKDDDKPAAATSSSTASIELSETELEQVTGGGEKKTPPKKPADKTDYLVVTMNDALIS